MAKNNNSKNKRRQQPRPIPTRTTPPKAAQRQSWFTRQSGGVQTLIILGGITALVVGHFVLWGAVIPALGTLVGRIPVVSTAAGWLLGGGAFMAWGVLAINHDTAKPTTVKRLKATAWAWTSVAALCIPTGYANDVVLPVDYWAGVYAGTYGVVASPLAAGVVALFWWLVVNKLAGHEDDPTKPQLGWICVGYSALLLVWGSTLLRM